MFRVQIEERKVIGQFAFAPKNVVVDFVSEHNDRSEALCYSRQLFKDWLIRQTERFVSYAKYAHNEAALDLSEKQVFSAHRLQKLIQYSLSKTDRFDVWLGYVLALSEHYKRVLPPGKNPWRKDLTAICENILEEAVNQLNHWKGIESMPLKKAS